MTFILYVIFCKQMTAYEVRISDWSSDVCSSDRPALPGLDPSERQARERLGHADQLFSARIRIGTVTNAPFDPLENRRETEEDIDAVERPVAPDATPRRSEEHTSELQSLMRISYTVFCLKKKNTTKNKQIQ